MGEIIVAKIQEKGKHVMLKYQAMLRNLSLFPRTHILTGLHAHIHVCPCPPWERACALLHIDRNTNVKAWQVHWALIEENDISPQNLKGSEWNNMNCQVQNL